MSKILGIYISLTLFVMTLLLFIISSQNHITAQTYESIISKRSSFKNNTQIELGKLLGGIAINSALNKVYVSDFTLNTVSVLDSNSGNITRNIRVGLGPAAIAIDPDSNKVYVVNSRSNTVSVIDSVNDKKEAKDIPVGLDPRDIAINPHTNKVYVANFRSNTVSLIYISNDTNIKNITVGKGPIAIGVDESCIFGCMHDKVYVANSGSNTVSVIDGSNDTNIKNITVGADPRAIAVNGYTEGVYVANTFSNTVSVIDIFHNTNIKNITVGKGPTDVAQFSDKVYVANENNKSVSVINSINDTNIKNITVGKGPTDVGRLSSINKVYVTNSRSNTVSVIDISNDTNIKNITVGGHPSAIGINEDKSLVYIKNNNTISVIKGSNDKVTAGITFNVSPEHSGNVVCNSNNNPNVFNNVYPTNTYIYVESGTKCYAKPNKDFQFSSWIENLGDNSTVTLNTTAFSDSPLDYFQRFLGANDTSATLQVNRFGSFTANFKHLPPPVPPEYWTSLFTVVATALVGSLLIPAGIAWFKSKRQTSRLSSYHRDIDLYGKDNIEWLNTSYNKLVNTYSEGKINNEQYTNLKTEISVLYEEIYKKRIESLKGNDNEIVLTGIGNDINDAHSKGKLSEKHFANLKTKISVFYQGIYNKKIDCANGNGILLDEVKNEIRDAFAKEKINEQHYKLLIEKISDNKNNHGSVNKLQSS